MLCHEKIIPHYILSRSDALDEYIIWYDALLWYIGLCCKMFYNIIRYDIALNYRISDLDRTSHRISCYTVASCFIILCCFVELSDILL